MLLPTGMVGSHLLPPGRKF